MALSGLLVAVAVSRVVITPATGGPAVPAWPGVALLIAAIGLLLAGVTAGDALTRPVTASAGTGGTARRGPRTLRGAGVAALSLLACSAPALAAAAWVTSGVRGPVGPVSGPVVPAVVSVSSTSGLQLRTLVLRSAGSQVSYSLQRGASPSLGDPDLAPAPAAQRSLNMTVAALVAPNGGEAVDQGQQLADFDIGFVLLPAPVNQNLARLLNSVAGLRPVSATSAFDLWRVTGLAARVRVVEPNGTVVAVPSGPVGVSGAAVPAAGGTIELAEPAGGWAATLNGQPLTSVPSSAGGWAQAFRLPAGGGVLSISHSQTGRDLLLVLELALVAVVAALALPGSRGPAEDGAPAASASRAASGTRAAGQAAEGGPRGGRRARGHSGRAARQRRDRDAVPAGPRPRGRRAGTGKPPAGQAGRRRSATADAAAGRTPAEGGPGPRAAWPAEEPPGTGPGPRAAWPDEPAKAGAGQRVPWPAEEPGSRGRVAGRRTGRAGGLAGRRTGRAGGLAGRGSGRARGLAGRGSGRARGLAGRGSGRPGGLADRGAGPAGRRAQEPVRQLAAARRGRVLALPALPGAGQLAGAAAAAAELAGRARRPARPAPARPRQPPPAARAGRR